MRLSLHLTAALLVPALAGCGATAYHPRPSPRLQIVADGGSIVLTRDGRTYPVGMFGSGLEDAVKGNERAEKEVSSYQSKTIGGFVLGLVGSLGSAGGVGLLVGNEVSNNPQNNLRIAAIALSISGIVLSIAGNVLTGSAQPHMWNAINMYNDDLPPPYGYGAQPGRPYAPYPAAPGYGPQPGYNGGRPPMPPGQPYAPYAAPPGGWAPSAPMPSAPVPNAPLPAAPPSAPMPSAPPPAPPPP